MFHLHKHSCYKGSTTKRAKRKCFVSLQHLVLIILIQESMFSTSGGQGTWLVFNPLLFVKLIMFKGCCEPPLFVVLLCARSSCGHFSATTLRLCLACLASSSFLLGKDLRTSCGHCQAYYAQGRAVPIFLSPPYFRCAQLAWPNSFLLGQDLTVPHFWWE